MPTWNEIKKSLGEIADKTVNATRELTDTAALKIKIANKESECDLEYKNLGRLAYIRLRELDSLAEENLAEEISASLEKLDNIYKELSELKATEKARKEAKEAEKQEKADEAKAKKQASDELDLTVMEEFNAARKVADDEYEKAKKAAEDAKAQG